MFAAIPYLVLGALLAWVFSGPRETMTEYRQRYQADQRRASNRRKFKAKPVPVKPVQTDLAKCQASGPYTGKTPYFWLVLVGLLFLAGLVIACIN